MEFIVKINNDLMLEGGIGKVLYHLVVINYINNVRIAKSIVKKNSYVKTTGFFLYENDARRIN